MSGFSMKTTLAGVENFRRQIALMNEKTRTRTKEAIRHGTEAVVTGAQSRVPTRSGELKFSIRSEIASNGLTGYAKAGYGKLVRRSHATTTAGKEKAQARRENARLQFRLANTSKQGMSTVNLGAYAPVVERGDPRRNRRPQPFMIPAFRAEKPNIVQRLKSALQQSASSTERAL